MPIIRIQKTQNYSIIANALFRDPSVSARAKGIYAYIMTLPDDWKLMKSHLYKQFTEGRDALDKAFQELESRHIITKSPVRKKDGTLDGWEYTITESLETRESVFPTDGRPAATKDLSIPSTDILTSAKKKADPATIAFIMRRWTARCGGKASFPRVGKAVKSLDEYTSDQIQSAWMNYERNTEPRFMSIESFASKIKAWLPQAAVELKDVSDEDFFKELT